MTALRLSTTPAVPALFGTLRQRLENVRPALQASVAFWRGDIEVEFATESWHPLSGPARPWKKTRAFGNQPPPRSTLTRSGALRRAWAGRGAGAIERITPQGAEFGVAGTLLPYAVVHRGGAGRVTAADSRRPEVIRVTPKMRRYLAAAKGVYLRSSTTEIRIPRRPHAGLNPRVKTGITAIFSRFMLTGRAEVPR